MSHVKKEVNLLFKEMLSLAGGMHIPAYKTASVDSAASVDDALAASDDASTSSNYANASDAADGDGGQI